MTIRVICKNCGSKIDAKDEIRGQLRRCPKCKEPLLIEPSEPLAADLFASSGVSAHSAVPVQMSSQIKADANPGLVGSSRHPNRLVPMNRYMICDIHRVIASWKVGEGWMLNVGNGFSPVLRNLSAIPDQGQFVFVELKIKETENGRRLSGIAFYSITARSALNALGRSETEILEKIKERVSLTLSQKRLVLDFIRKTSFPEFTENVPEIVDFLTNTSDFHSNAFGE